jgi:ubiquinol-cytochrome c reductase cytochrome b subunit
MKLRRLAWGTAVLVILLGGTGLTAGHPVADPATPTLGQDLYQRLSCRGCHAWQGRGGEVGPVLNGVGSRLSRTELETQILTPRRRQADSRMPSFAFVRPKELQALLDFLESLK